MNLYKIRSIFFTYVDTISKVTKEAFWFIYTLLDNFYNKYLDTSRNMDRRNIRYKNFKCVVELSNKGSWSTSEPEVNSVRLPRGRRLECYATCIGAPYDALPQDFVPTGVQSQAHFIRVIFEVNIEDL